MMRRVMKEKSKMNPKDLFKKSHSMLSSEASPAVLSRHEDDTDRLLCLTLDIGEHMLRNGGEIHRVEDTMERICRAYGAQHVEVFVITSLVMAAIRMPNGAYSSQFRRVYGSSKDLYRLERLNAVSRRICAERPSLDEVERLIDEAKRARPYSELLFFIGSFLAAGAFAVFFGGSWRDGIAAALVGLILATVEYFGNKAINRMANTVILSFVLGVLSILSVRLGIGQNIGFVTIGAIMLLIPGLDFGSAIRDLLCGNLLSGTLLSVQSLLIAAMIALGYAASVVVMGGVMA